LLEPWKAARAKFNQRLLARFGSGAYNTLLKVDIVRYFESVDHRRLAMLLRHARVPRSAIKHFMALLHFWFGGRRKGLPQSSEIFSLLGNVYLAEVDMILASAGVVYFRWMDDFYILASSTEEAERAEQILKDALEPLGLALHTGEKRVLVEGEDLEPYLQDKHAPWTRDSASRLAAAELALEDAQRVVQEIAAEVPVVDDRFVGALKTFGKRREQTALPAALAELPRRQHLSEQVVQYVKACDGVYADALVDVLQRSEPSDFMEAWAANALVDQELSESGLNFVRDRLVDRRSNPAARSYYALRLGQRGSAEDVSLLIDMLGESNSPFERRALVASLRNAPKALRNQVYLKVIEEDSRLKWTVEWVRAQAP
jgi:hypothetical protein